MANTSLGVFVFDSDVSVLLVVCYYDCIVSKQLQVMRFFCDVLVFVSVNLELNLYLKTGRFA